MVMWLQPNADHTTSSLGMHGARQPLQHTHEWHVTRPLHPSLQWVLITNNDVVIIIAHNIQVFNIHVFLARWFYCHLQPINYHSDRHKYAVRH
jgi:hypothetical protein